MVTDIYMDLVYNPSIISKRMVFNTLVRTTASMVGLGVVGKGVKVSLKTYISEKAAIQTTGRWLPGAGEVSKLDKGDFR